MNKKDLGRQIKEVRTQNGLTQESLAQKCNLDIRTIQRIESGVVMPRFYTIQIINKVLGTNFNLNGGNIFQKGLNELRYGFNSLASKDDLFPILMINSFMWALVIIVLPNALNETSYFKKIYPILAGGAVISIIAVTKAWEIRKRNLKLD